MELKKDTMVISSNEIGERLNHFASMFMNTLLGSKSTYDKLTIYYTDGGRIEVTYYKGKELDWQKFNPSNEIADSGRTSSIGFIDDKLTGYTYWNKCGVDRIEMLYW
jgi:hypothetical protein